MTCKHFLWDLRPSQSSLMTTASLLLITPLPWHTIHSYSELPAASWIYPAFVCPHKSAWNPSHQHPGFTDLHWQTPNHLSKLISNPAATVDPHVCKISTLSQKTCQPLLLWLHYFCTNIYHYSINISLYTFKQLCIICLLNYVLQGEGLWLIHIYIHIYNEYPLPSSCSIKVCWINKNFISYH